MLKYGVYRANSKQWDRYAAIQKPQNLLRRKKTSGKVAGDTYSLSKFSNSEFHLSYLEESKVSN